MRLAPRFMLIWLALMICVAPAVAATVDEDDSVDLAQSRVARITVTRGDVQIRRADSQEWEEAAPNLPLVEGDRIATGQDSRVEIQFDRDNYLRLAEDSILKIVTLNDNGVAVSLPEGILSVRLGSLKNKRDSFEIDAPDTTIAAEREGLYRVDAPQGSRSNELKISVTDGGQARVYSETSGYTVRNGRVARVFLSGDYAGDADLTAQISRDYFDDWVATRENDVTRLRRDEYRAYYDADVYGADDLNDYGEWINTSRYGWVWRPSQNSIAGYDHWTPYRYGHWRYISNYGWTWIADEPWGWATSHYGRWVYLEDGWSWCPYEYGRRHRSRWQAALVVFVNIGRNICWYPLPYDCYYSYNYRSRRIVYNTTVINNTTIVNNTTVINNNPTRNPNDVPRRGIDQMPGRRNSELDSVYAASVTRMPLENFGKVKKGIAPATDADSRLAVGSLKNKGEVKVDLPVYSSNADARIVKGREVIEKRQTLKEAEFDLERNNNKIGAMPRAQGTTLDGKLREDRVFKGRTPNIIVRDDSKEVRDDNSRQPRTGVFDRQPRIKENRNTDNNGDRPRDDTFERPRPRTPKPENRNSDNTGSNDRRDQPPVKAERDETQNPIERPRPRPSRKEERDNDGGNNDKQRQPAYDQPRQKEPERREEKPRPEPPHREERRSEQPKQTDMPRVEQPKQREEPRPDPPKQREEPKREEPKREEPRHNDSAPAKSEKPGKDGARK